MGVIVCTMFRILKQNGSLVGYSVVDDNSKVLDMPLPKLIEYVTKGVISVRNLSVESNIFNTSVTISNGSESRYTCINNINFNGMTNRNIENPQALTVLFKNNEDITLVSSNGKVATIKLNQLIKMVLDDCKYTLSNASIVSGKFIRAISGELEDKSVDNSTVEIIKNKDTNVSETHSNYSVKPNVPVVKVSENTVIDDYADAINREKYRSKIYKEKENEKGIASQIVYGDHTLRDETLNLTVEEKVLLCGTTLKYIDPFLYAAFLELRKVYLVDGTLGQQTLAVSDDTIFICVGMTQKIKLPMLSYLILHEIYHIIMRHYSRRSNRNMLVWNYACDYFVNMQIKESYNCYPNSSIVRKLNNSSVQIGLEFPTDFMCSKDGVNFEPASLIFNDDINVKTDTVESIYEKLMNENKPKQDKNGDSNNSNNGNDSSQENSSNSSQNQGENSQQGQNGDNSKQGQDGDNSQNQQGSNSQQEDNGDNPQGDTSQQGNKGKDNSQDEHGKGDSQDQDGEHSQDQDGEGNSQGQQEQNGDSTSQGQDNGGYSEGQDGQSGEQSQSQSGQNNSQQREINSNSQNESEKTTDNSEMTYNGKRMFKDKKEFDKANKTQDLQLEDDKTIEEKNKRDGENRQGLGIEKHSDEDAKNLIRRILQRSHNMGLDKDSKLAREIEMTLIRDPSWKSFIKKFLNDMTLKEPSFMTPNKKMMNHGYILPGDNKNDTNDLKDILVAVDTSGSVDDVTLMQSLGYIGSLFRSYKVSGDIIYWNTSISGPYQFKDFNTYYSVSKRVCGTGGTDVSIVFSYLKNKTHKYADTGKVSRTGYKLVVIITDGYIGDVDKSWLVRKKETKVIWIITDSSKLKTFNPPFGKVAPITPFN